MKTLKSTPAPTKEPVVHFVDRNSLGNHLERMALRLLPEIEEGCGRDTEEKFDCRVVWRLTYGGEWTISCRSKKETRQQSFIGLPSRFSLQSKPGYLCDGYQIGNDEAVWEVVSGLTDDEAIAWLEAEPKRRNK